MSSLMKVYQLNVEILHPQGLHTWSSMAFTSDPMTLSTLSVYLLVMMSNHVEFDEDPLTRYGDMASTGFSDRTLCDLDL